MNNCAADDVRQFVSYILGEPIASLVELASSTSVINYVTMIVLMMCTFLLNKKVIKDISQHANAIDALQKKSIENDKLLDEYKCENSKLRKKLAESERKRGEAEALAERYWKMLSDAQRATEESLKIANSNRVQHTSGDTSGC